MFEFRFKETEVPSTLGTVIKVKLLQYRYNLLPCTHADGSIVLYVPNIEQPWVTVPLATDEPPAAKVQP